MKVGADDGTEDGVRLGSNEIDGRDEGCCVGKDDRESDGKDEVESEGCCDGEDEGRSDGLDDGMFDNDTVGGGDGI